MCVYISLDLVHFSHARAQASPWKRIIFGPPSTIRWDTACRYRGGQNAAAPLSKARTRIRYREVPLTANDLYLDDARPRAEVPVAGHKFVVCHCQCVKSHPVAYVFYFIYLKWSG